MPVGTRLAGRLALLATLAAGGALADDVRPVNVQVKESAPGEFLVQWQVPTVLPPRAAPVPTLPEGCEPRGQASTTEQPGVRVHRRTFRCPDGIAGRNLGIDFPVANPSITTLLRLELLSGEQMVHVLQPGESSWRVPNPTDGSLPAAVRQARRGLLRGAEHVLKQGVHWALLLAVVLVAYAAGAGGRAGVVRWITGFSAGQLAGMAAGVNMGPSAARAPVELGLAVAIVILAGESLRPSEDRRGRWSVAAAAGVFHGIGIGGVALSAGGTGTVWLPAAAAVLGMDAVLLLVGLAMAEVSKRLALGARHGTLKRILAYGLGGAGVAAALAIALVSPTRKAEATASETRLPGLSAGISDTTLQPSRRVAPSVPDTPVQGFLAIEPFEVRHEVLIRPAMFRRQLGLEGVAILEVARQAEVKARAGELVAAHTLLTIDGKSVDPRIDRVDFLVVGPTGVLPKPLPAPESLPEAWIGATLLYETGRTPREVTLDWRPFPEVGAEIPMTVTDPEVTRSSVLTAAEPGVVWKNELVEDPMPALTAVAVTPASLSFSTLSLALLAAALLLVVRAFRGRRRHLWFALTRVALALALALAPMARIALALPGSAGSAPSPEQARVLLTGTLRNIYRALESRDESTAYDRLAVSVTGDSLAEIYLEHRRAMEMEERGGARARVQAVEVPEVRLVEAAPEGGFAVEAAWTVGGTVTHFGHRHFRQNRYDARVTLIADDDAWKIRAIEILDEERLR